MCELAHTAVRYCKVDILSKALQDGVLPRCTHAGTGRALLYIAVASKCGTAMSLLVSSGADVNFSGYGYYAENETPLDSAYFTGNTAAIRYLTDKGGKRKISDATMAAAVKESEAREQSEAARVTDQPNVDSTAAIVALQQMRQTQPQSRQQAPLQVVGVGATSANAAAPVNRRGPVTNCVLVTTERDYKPKLGNEEYRWVFQNNCSSEVALTFFPKGGRDKIQPDGFSAKSAQAKNLRPGESSSHTVYKQSLPVNLEFVACPTPTTVGPRFDSAQGWYCSAY